MADIIGLDKVAADIRNLSRASSEAAREALRDCGRLAVREAKRRAPRSPTNKILSATLKRKKRTSRKMLPGGLEKSIEFESDYTGCSVFVASNSKAGKYAKRIHDERYSTWRNLGPGSIAKGGAVGEKFIERGIRENIDNFRTIIAKWLNRTLRKAWGG